MENNVLLGATETVVQYDGSGVFNPSSTAPETSKVVTASSTLPAAEEAPASSPMPTDNTTAPKTGLLLYGALALAAYFFFFKKK